MADSIIIKTTGGDIHITPDIRVPVQDHADRIVDAIEDTTRNSDWIRLHVDRGQAQVHIPSITGIIARTTGRSKGF